MPSASTGYYGYDSAERFDPDQENMIISAAGPGINLAFALIFLGILFIVPLRSILSIIALYGFGLNVGLGSFNMLPIPPLDGSKIFRKNILVALALAGPLWAMFALLFSGFFQIS
jgi:Zn-dependent protease